MNNNAPEKEPTASQSPAGAVLSADPLPSWNDGPAKRSIIDFVVRVTTGGSPSFVSVPERIATFDNDGTLCCEQPAPVQASLLLSIIEMCF